MNINNTEGIKADVTLIGKKSKTDKSKYCIYIAFYIYHKGIKQFSPSISTGISVEAKSWKQGRVLGNSDKVKELNLKLDNYKSSATDFLNMLSAKKIASCTDALNEINANAKVVITGKAPRGFKNDFLSKLKEYDYEEIQNRYLQEAKHSKDRKRNYLLTLKLMNEYFNNKIPTLNLLTSKDLTAFKKFMLEKYENENTQTTFLGMVASVINYAVRLGVIHANPLPKDFTGSFKDGNRAVLSESECMKIMMLNDNLLSRTEQVAKYSLLVQMLTGIGYKDLKNLEVSKLKYDFDENQFIISNLRSKTKIPYIVNLTENAKYHVDKLRELTGNTELLFVLPSIEYALRMYKKIGKKAGVFTNIGTYTLRHTFAVDFMDSDGRLEDLQVRLGHTDIKTTQIYGKISAKRNAQTTKKLESKSKIHQLQKTIKLEAV